MQAYFLDRLDANDMISIKELVRVFCSNYGKVLFGDIPINAILPGDSLEYLEPSEERNKAMIVKVFADDRAFHQAASLDIRKLPFPI